MTNIINGKELSKRIREELKDKISDLNIKPTLCTVLVGEDPASQVYVKNKRKQAEKCGITSIHHQLDSNIAEQDLLSLIKNLNQDPDINGILVQLPLPKHINEHKIINAVDPRKDVDGFHPENVGLLSIGEPRFVSCTPKGCLKLIKTVQQDLSGLHAVIVGRSNIVGKPVASLLLKEHCTVTICHSKTKNLESITKQADILVAAVGRAHMLNSNHIKPNSIIIDVGINRLGPDQNNKLVGDIDYDNILANGKAKAITPVPGGVGPMTIAMLLENTVEACLNDQ